MEEQGKGGGDREHDPYYADTRREAPNHDGDDQQRRVFRPHSPHHRIAGPDHQTQKGRLRHEGERQHEEDRVESHYGSPDPGVSACHLQLAQEKILAAYSRQRQDPRRKTQRREGESEKPAK